MVELGDEIVARVVESTRPRPRHFSDASMHRSLGPRGRGPRASFPEWLSRTRDLVEELRQTTLARWAELGEMCSALAVEEAHLQEGRHQLEALIRAAKAVYDHDVAEVEREHTALDTEHVEAAKALREL
ncbi:hypothetical protein E2562_023855 [Oryza meyeriana var. granulata]|uniref:Uncharacterized protein n=1 Tax=Oryza meyeriana var. granulata TaxID=110450 RepID=A0A6G1D8Z5_9ORYZ|nr:hypothetical protein E2562_023855 [Oryza meyeriana var. granulata]